MKSLSPVILCILLSVYLAGFFYISVIHERQNCGFAVFACFDFVGIVGLLWIWCFPIIALLTLIPIFIADLKNPLLKEKQKARLKGGAILFVALLFLLFLFVKLKIG